jgi:cysteinyl-tRNA synthetase
VIRLNMLRTHYRQPIDWTVRGLEDCSKVLESWYVAIGDVEPADSPDPAFVAAICDDLNTPLAISRLHELAHPPVAGLAMAGVSVLGDRVGEDAQRHLKSSAMLIGLLEKTASQRQAMKIANAGVDRGAVDLLVAGRNAARAAKNFKEADRIRDELAAMGITLKDAKDPKTGELVTTWEVAR